MAKKAANPGVILRGAKVVGKLVKDPRVRSKTKQVWNKSKDKLARIGDKKGWWSSDAVSDMTATSLTVGFMAGQQGGKNKNSTDNMNKGELDKKIGGK